MEERKKVYLARSLTVLFSCFFKQGAPTFSFCMGHHELCRQPYLFLSSCLTVMQTILALLLLLERVRISLIARPLYFLSTWQALLPNIHSRLLISFTLFLPIKCSHSNSPCPGCLKCNLS